MGTSIAKKPKGKMTRQKKTGIVISAILIAALLITGTMAWNSLMGEVLNEWDNRVPPGGVGRDDFDGEEEKDVYFENYGKTPLFVRIRLDEYMERDEEDPNSYPIPIVKENADPTRGVPDVDDKKTWEPHIAPDKDHPELSSVPDSRLSDPGEDFNLFWEWNMGASDGTRYYLPTDKNDVDAGIAKRNEDFYYAADAATNPDLKKVPEATVVTMAKWIDMGSPVGKYWVLDTDGWAYWAEALPGFSSTGLILNGVKPTGADPGEYYYYGINVIYQATDKKEIDLLKDAASPAAKDLLDKILAASTTAKSSREKLKALLDQVAPMLQDATANPGKYTPGSVSALEAVYNAGVIFHADPGATDLELDGAYDDIKDKLPLVLASTSTAPLETRDSDPAFVYIQANDDLHAAVSVDVSGTRTADPGQHDGSIALEDLFTNTDFTGLSVAALDTSVFTNSGDFYIQADPNNGGKLSLFYAYYPSPADMTQIENGSWTGPQTWGSTDPADGFNPIVETTLHFTLGTSTADVIVRLNYTGSLFGY